MTPVELLALLALVGYAIYKQTKIAEVTAGSGRFLLPALYAAVGIAVGGFGRPHGVAGAGFLVASLALSVGVGLARGRLTRVWRTPDDRVVRQGTALTIGLFLGMVAVKVVLGAVASVAGIQDGAGFGEVLVAVAVMLLVQSEIVRARAQQLLPTRAGADTLEARQAV